MHATAATRYPDPRRSLVQRFRRLSELLPLPVFSDRVHPFFAADLVEQVRHHRGLLYVLPLVNIKPYPRLVLTADDGL